jgi:hypothetical protein
MLFDGAMVSSKREEHRRRRAYVAACLRCRVPSRNQEAAGARRSSRNAASHLARRQECASGSGLLQQLHSSLKQSGITCVQSPREAGHQAALLMKTGRSSSVAIDWPIQCCGDGNTTVL